ncbi:MAG: hypothetical protein RIA64_00340 [Rhodospirillales bacterium]
MDILKVITEFEDSLKKEAPEEAAEKWWSWCSIIESKIEFDPHKAKYETETIESLKRAVSHAIKTAREYDRHETFQIDVALSALRRSVERRTTGANGYPLRK